MRRFFLCLLLLPGCTTAVFHAPQAERPVLVGPRATIASNAVAAGNVHAELSVNRVLLVVLPAPEGREAAVDGVENPEATFRETPGYLERGVARIGAIEVRAGTFLAFAVNAWAAWGTVHAELWLHPEAPTNALEPPDHDAGNGGSTNGEAE